MILVEQTTQPRKHLFVDFLSSSVSFYSLLLSNNSGIRERFQKYNDDGCQ